MWLNFQFRDVAVWCTDRENHKYQSTYDNSLILKRFVFEFFDCFFPLIYLGWWDLNFKVLRANVISVYMADELRRVATESLLPYLMQNSNKLSRGLEKIQASLKRGNTLKKEAKTITEQKEIEAEKVKAVIAEELEELERDEHEIFDDYMEMIMTFGYITMFTSVFSFGATLIFLFIMIEARSDIFRMEMTCKRPIPEKSNTIGSWVHTIELFCILSVFSNLIVTCFASDQIDYLLPWMAGLKETSVESMTTIIGLEHLILGVVVVLRFLYKREPNWVDIFLARKAYKRDKK